MRNCFSDHGVLFSDSPCTYVWSDENAALRREHLKRGGKIIYRQLFFNSFKTFPISAFRRMPRDSISRGMNASPEFTQA